MTSATKSISYGLYHPQTNVSGIGSKQTETQGKVVQVVANFFKSIFTALASLFSTSSTTPKQERKTYTHLNKEDNDKKTQRVRDPRELMREDKKLMSSMKTVQSKLNRTKNKELRSQLATEFYSIKAKIEQVNKQIRDLS